MIVVIGGKTIKGNIRITVHSEGAEPLSPDSASAMDAPID